MGILEAAQKAADVTGAFDQSNRKWAAMYLTCMIGITPEEMDDTAVETLLSSERGKGIKIPLSLIHDQDFRLEARELCVSKQLQKGVSTISQQTCSKSGCKNAFNKRSAPRQHDYGCIPLVFAEIPQKGCVLRRT